MVLISPHTGRLSCPDLARREDDQLWDFNPWMQGRFQKPDINLYVSTQQDFSRPMEGDKVSHRTVCTEWWQWHKTSCLHTYTLVTMVTLREGLGDRGVGKVTQFILDRDFQSLQKECIHILHKIIEQICIYLSLNPPKKNEKNFIVSMCLHIPYF